MQRREQFVAVDDYTFRIDFLRKDKLTMPHLTVPSAVVINSELAKKHATDKDPWAMDWLKNNEAGGGGQELIYQRFDEWKSGPVPKIQRVIWRIVPSAGNRRALIERGDADISVDLPPKDVAEMAADTKLTVVGSLIESALIYLTMNVKIAPFGKVKVRQAVAYRCPIRRSWMRRCSVSANRCSAVQVR